MDYNFSDMVNEGLRRGLRYEEIAADFTKALNEIQKKYQEEAVREAYVEDCLDRLADWETESCDASLSLAADMATLAAYDTHNSWSTDRLRKFNEDAVDQLKALIDLYEMEEKGDPFSLHVRCMLDAAKAAEQKVEKCDCKCGEDKDKDTKADDAETLLKFLKDFGVY